MDTSSASALNADCDAFAACCAEADAGVFVNIGPCLTPEAAKCIPGMLQRHASLNCSLRVGCCKGIPDATMLKAAAETVLQITDVCPTGETCFKFAATFNCAPGIPFFPAGERCQPSWLCNSIDGMVRCGGLPTGYHEGPRSFAVGLENQNIVVQAFKSANKDLAAAAVNLKKLYEDSYMPIQEACHKLANEHNIPVGVWLCAACWWVQPVLNCCALYVSLHAYVCVPVSTVLWPGCLNRTVGCCQAWPHLDGRL